MSKKLDQDLITWVSCHDPVNGISRRCTWIGETRRIIVTGLPAAFVDEAPRSFELPPGSMVHEVPAVTNGLDLARQLGGVLFIVPAPASCTPLPEVPLTSKRYFEMADNGAEYVVVASDLEHAERILRDAGLTFGQDSVPYDAAKAAGLLTWDEVSTERAAKRQVCSNESSKPYKVLLTECTLGDWFCSEW
jgi:hypothetical protein